MTFTDGVTRWKYGGTLWVCVDCLMSGANGEEPEERPEGHPEPWALWPNARLGELSLGLTAGEHECIVPGDCDLGCERIEFSWRNCEGCGSWLGGERHAYTWWEIIG